MWNFIVEADVLTRISGTELAAFRAAALQSGQADPVADEIAQVVNEVRGYIAACLRNTLGPVGTIPDMLKNAALSLIILNIMARAAGRIIDPKGERKDAAAKAVELLRDVAACKFALDVPDTFTTETIATGTPSFSRNHRRNRFSQRDQNGI